VAPWRILEADGPHDLAVTGSMIVNDMPTMLSAALGGAGLAQLPAPLAAEQLASGQLVEVLADYAASSPGLFIYFPSRAQVMPKLRAFIDHMKAYAQEVLLN
jgi:DNA-binding transcriptional LysR family regulator